MTLVADGDPTATYRVKGYLSAVGDVERHDAGLRLDVSDAPGTRLHRFSGQEPATAAAPTRGSAVTGDQIIDEAARDTIDALADWTRA